MIDPTADPYVIPLSCSFHSHSSLSVPRLVSRSWRCTRSSVRSLLPFPAVLWLPEGVHSRPSRDPGGVPPGGGQARPLRLRRKIHCWKLDIGQLLHVRKNWHLRQQPRQQLFFSDQPGPPLDPAYSARDGWRERSLIGLCYLGCRVNMRAPAVASSKRAYFIVIHNLFYQIETLNPIIIRIRLHSVACYMRIALLTRTTGFCALVRDGACTVRQYSLRVHVCAANRLPNPGPSFFLRGNAPAAAFFLGRQHNGIIR